MKILPEEIGLQLKIQLILLCHWTTKTHTKTEKVALEIFLWPHIKLFRAVWLCMPLYPVATHRGIFVTTTVGSYREQLKQSNAQRYVANINILISAKLKKCLMGVKDGLETNCKKNCLRSTDSPFSTIPLPWGAHPSLSWRRCCYSHHWNGNRLKSHIVWYTDEDRSRYKGWDTWWRLRRSMLQPLDQPTLFFQRWWRIYGGNTNILKFSSPSVS